MDPITIIMLANAAIDLGLRLYGAVKDDPATPEEIKARADIAFTALSAVAAKVAAYQPIPPLG